MIYSRRTSARGAREAKGFSSESWLVVVVVVVVVAAAAATAALREYGSSDCAQRRAKTDGETNCVFALYKEPDDVFIYLYFCLAFGSHTPHSTTIRPSDRLAGLSDPELAPTGFTFAYFASLFICSLQARRRSPLPVPSWLPKFHQVGRACKRLAAKKRLAPV